MCSSKIFGGGSSKPPPPPPPPPAPDRMVEDAVKRRRKGERGRQAAMAGRQSTILTGPTGLSDEANTSGKTLLGQ